MVAWPCVCGSQFFANIFSAQIFRPKFFGLKFLAKFFGSNFLALIFRPKFFPAQFFQLKFFLSPIFFQPIFFQPNFLFAPIFLTQFFQLNFFCPIFLVQICFSSIFFFKKICSFCFVRFFPTLLLLHIHPLLLFSFESRVRQKLLHTKPMKRATTVYKVVVASFRMATTTTQISVFRSSSRSHATHAIGELKKKAIAAS